MGKNEINLADNLINIINTARENALKKVNEELINMYWQVGEYLHKESQKSMFGDGLFCRLTQYSYLSEASLVMPYRKGS